MNARQARQLVNIAARLERRSSLYLANSFEIAKELLAQADDELAKREHAIRVSRNIVSPGAFLRLIITGK